MFTLRVCHPRAGVSLRPREPWQFTVPESPIDLFQDWFQVRDALNHIMSARCLELAAGLVQAAIAFAR